MTIMTKKLFLFTRKKYCEHCGFSFTINDVTFINSGRVGRQKNIHPLVLSVQTCIHCDLKMLCGCKYFFVKYSRKKIIIHTYSCFYFYNKSEIDVTMSRRSQMWFELVTHKKFKIKTKTNCHCNVLKLQSLLIYSEHQ